MSDPLRVIFKVLVLVLAGAVYAFFGYVLLLYMSLWDMAHMKGPACCWVETTHYVEITWVALSIGAAIGVLSGYFWLTKPAKISN